MSARAGRRIFNDVESILRRLVAIPSVSATGWDPVTLRRSADATAELLGTAAPRVEARLLEVEGAPPAVVAHMSGSGPRVLLYAHHDVQPPGDARGWTHPPFEPVVRGGRLYGRGAADNKAGIAMHAAALASLPSGAHPDVVVLVEGEEEVGSPHLEAFLDRHGDLLCPDVIISADAGLPHVDRPGLTVSLRGLVDCVVEVRTLSSPLHSGVFGGAAPDALTALARLLATLHDDGGHVTLEASTPAEGDDLGAMPEALVGVLESLAGARLWSSVENLPRRLWLREAVSVLGIDAPSVADASNQLIPVARAKVSLRVGPREDPARAAARLAEHLVTHAPWGAEVTVTPGAVVPGVRVDRDHPVLRRARAALETAWGCPALVVGSGGSVPAVSALAARFADAPLVMFGAADPLAHSHGPDESVHLEALRRAVLAEVLLLEDLATT